MREKYSILTIFDKNNFLHNIFLFEIKLHVLQELLKLYK